MAMPKKTTTPWPPPSVDSVLMVLSGLLVPSQAQAQTKRPNVVMLMSDDTGWADLGVYLGGAALGHLYVLKTSSGEDFGFELKQYLFLRQTPR